MRRLNTPMRPHRHRQRHFRRIFLMDSTPINRAIAELERAVLLAVSRRSRARKSKIVDIVSGLVFDLECVVRGLRPGTLLNSLPFPPTHDTDTTHDTLCALHALIDEMARAYRGSCSHAIRIFNSDDCLLVVDTETLGAGWPMPRGIRFADDVVRWMNDSEQSALEHQLIALAALLAGNGQGGDACSPSEDLETSLQGAGIAVSIPTVYGYVLGYPCTYEIISREHATMVSRWLSSAHLVFYYCRVRRGGETDNAALPVLLSFSVPKQLVESREEGSKWNESSERNEWNEWKRCLAGWRDGMVARASRPLGRHGLHPSPFCSELVFDTQVRGQQGIVI